MLLPLWGALAEWRQAASALALAAICALIIAVSASGKAGHLQSGLGRAEMSQI
jgi:anti-sigma-K factor RskA